MRLRADIREPTKPRRQNDLQHINIDLQLRTAKIRSAYTILNSILSCSSNADAITASAAPTSPRYLVSACSAINGDPSTTGRVVGTVITILDIVHHRTSITTTLSPGCSTTMALENDTEQQALFHLSLRIAACTVYKATCRSETCRRGTRPSMRMALLWQLQHKCWRDQEDVRKSLVAKDNDLCCDAYTTVASTCIPLKLAGAYGE